MKVIGKRSVSSFLKVVLDAGWYLLVVVLVISFAILVFSLFSGSRGNGSLSVPVFLEVDSKTYEVASSSLGIDRAELDGIRTNLRFPARRGPFLYANLVLLTSLLGVALWIVTELRRVFRTLQSGTPFVRENADRIRRLAFAVILAELVRSAVVYFENYYAMTHFTGNGIRFGAPLDLSVTALLNGLIILVIAEVFRMGSRLEEEQKLTI